MWEETEAMRIFTPDMLETMAHIWTRSSISLMDIRHKTIYQEQPMRQYKMPSSMLVYAYGGTGSIQLNESIFAIERLGLFHGGKGTMLSIVPEGGVLGSYMVLYKAETPPFFKKDLQRLLEQVNPFVQQFGYAPSNPVRLLHLFQEMMDSWSRGTAMNHFHTKNLFHQSIYEIYKDFELKETKFLQPDPVLSAKRYLDEHYMRPIMFQEIADIFGISGGQLTRLFKKREGKSLQQYLTLKRLEVAQHQLKHTNATVKEIAYGCGFFNENLLLRAFKKHYNVSPGEYRKKVVMSMHDLCVDNDYQRSYNEIGLNGLARSQREGELIMFGQTRSKQMILAVALSTMLLLSACTAPVNSSSNSSAADRGNEQRAPIQHTPQEGVQSTAAMRIFEHLGGTTQVPEEPQRIVADWYYGELLTLGVRPIGYPEYLLSEYPYVEPQETEGFGDAVEQIVAMEPDLIISTFDDSYEKYAQIAPSVLLKNDAGLFDRLRMLGDLVNRKQEAEAWIASFEQKLEVARQRIATEASPDTTVTILNIFGKNLKVNGYRNMGGDVLYNMLQVNPPQRVQEMFEESNAWNHNVSLEVLPEIAGTHIILTAYEPEESGRETLAQLESSNIWKNLDAVKNNRVYKIDYYDLFFDDPIAIEHQLELLTDIIVQ